MCLASPGGPADRGCLVSVSAVKSKGMPIQVFGVLSSLWSPPVRIEVCVSAIARDGLSFPASVSGAVWCGRGGHAKDTTEIAPPAS